MATEEKGQVLVISFGGEYSRSCTCARVEALGRDLGGSDGGVWACIIVCIECSVLLAIKYA